MYHDTVCKTQDTSMVAGLNILVCMLRNKKAWYMYVTILVSALQITPSVHECLQW